MKNVVALSLLASGVSAFPYVAKQRGVDNSLHRRQQPGGSGTAADPAKCPFNANHQPAAPVTDEFPYNNAKNGLPGNRQGGILVPDPNDEAHQYVPANPDTDIRGPCPGLNAAANHNFLAHDGITTFNELVDAQQNVYNVDYDLSILLALLGLTLTDGDIVTEKLSIGCDATSRTSFSPALTGSEPGLNGHNKFEADSSLTRNDFFTNDGDNFSFNGTLFGMMDETCDSYFNRENLSKYREQRWMQSQAENPNFFFGPLTLLLYGAASFLYELMPSGTRNYEPVLQDISAFFGTEKDANGNWQFIGERIPDDWTTRATPYSNNDVTREILTMYLENPVQFGGNTDDGTFNAIGSYNLIQNGVISPSVDPQDSVCLLYQLAFGQIPGYANSIITPTVDALSFITTKLSGTDFSNLGCPIPLT
ncbi:hypothetical protein MBLNU230_g1659t1 [Neophaeotheca triangularis]